MRRVCDVINMAYNRLSNITRSSSFIMKNITFAGLNCAKNGTNPLVTFAHLIISLDANRSFNSFEYSKSKTRAKGKVL